MEQVYILIANLILQTGFVSLVTAVGRTVLFKAEKSSHSLQEEEVSAQAKIIFVEAPG